MPVADEMRSRAYLSRVLLSDEEEEEEDSA